MSEYEVYDLSGGWDDFLKKNIVMNSSAHQKIADNTASEEIRRIQLGIVSENNKVLTAINKYTRFDMTLRVYSNQALRMFWVLIENCLFYKNGHSKEKERVKELKNAILEIKKAVSGNSIDDVRRIADSVDISDPTEEADEKK